MLLEVVVVKACSCRTHATPPRVWASVANQLDSCGSVRFTRLFGASEGISRWTMRACPSRSLYLDSGELVATVYCKDFGTPTQRYVF